MALRIQQRGHSTQSSETYTGLEREITIDTGKKTVRVHDGVTAGGVPLARESDIPSDAEIGDKAFSNPPDDLTNQEMTAVRTAVGAGTSSFSGSYNDLTNRPSMGIDTTLWQGNWVISVYSVGDIVIFSGGIYLCIVARDANDADDPSVDNTSWEQLDIGGPDDLVGALRNGLNLRFRRRNGTTINIPPLTAAQMHDILSASFVAGPANPEVGDDDVYVDYNLVTRNNVWDVSGSVFRIFGMDKP